MKQLYTLLLCLCAGFITAQSNFTVSPTPSVVSAGYTVQATVSSTVAGVTSYSWTVATAASSCAASQTAASNGTSCVFSFPCCSNFTISCVPYTGSVAGSVISKAIACGAQPTQLTELSSATPVLFPNPSNGVVTLKGITAKAELIISTLEGKVVFNTTIDANTTIDVSGLPAGLYTYSLNAAQRGKLVIE